MSEPAAKPRRLRVPLDGNASWPHPDRLAGALERLMPASHLEGFDTEWFHLRSAVELIEHIARHPAGTESIIKQLRQYRRELKKEKKP